MKMITQIRSASMSMKNAYVVTALKDQTVSPAMVPNQKGNTNITNKEFKSQMTRKFNKVKTRLKINTNKLLKQSRK